MNLLFLLIFSLLARSENAALRVQLAGEPNSLDPFEVSDLLSYNIIANVAEGLVRLDGAGKLRNALAASYKISRDGKTYRFRLRQDAKWSDGKPVTIEDFLFGLNLARDPKTAARDGTLLASVTAVRRDKDELVITLAQADASFLQILAMPLCAPLREDLWRANGNRWKAEWPSTGAYRIAVHKPDREIRLEPNPHNGGAKLAVQFRVVPEEVTALNLFETGGIDVLTTITSTDMPRLEKAGLLQWSPTAASFYLVFNIAKAPFNDIRWRRAIAGAVNRANLERLQPGGLTPTTSFLPSAVPGATAYDKERFAKDVAWAKAEKNKPEVTLVYAGNALGNMLLQRLQSDLRKDMGLEIRLEPMEWKAFLGRLDAGAPPLLFMGYSAAFDDSLHHLRLFKGHEADNRWKYLNPKYDVYVEEMKKSAGKARAKAAEKAQRVLTEEDVVVVPLLERRQAYGVVKGVKGFRVNPFGVMDLREFSR